MHTTDGLWYSEQVWIRNLLTYLEWVLTQLLPRTIDGLGYSINLTGSGEGMTFWNYFVPLKTIIWNSDLGCLSPRERRKLQQNPPTLSIHKILHMLMEPFWKFVLSHVLEQCFSTGVPWRSCSLLCYRRERAPLTPVYRGGCRLSKELSHGCIKFCFCQVGHLMHAYNRTWIGTRDQC